MVPYLRTMLVAAKYIIQFYNIVVSTFRSLFRRSLFWQDVAAQAFFRIFNPIHAWEKPPVEKQAVFLQRRLQKSNYRKCPT